MEKEVLQHLLKSVDALASSSKELASKILVMNWRLFALEQSLSDEYRKKYLGILEESYQAVSSELESQKQLLEKQMKILVRLYKPVD